MVDETNGDPVSRVTITTDADGWFDAVSPSLLALIRRPIEALAGLNLLDLVHPLDAAAARAALNGAAAGADAVSADVRLFTADDSWTPMRLAMRGVGDGRVIVDALLLDTEDEPASPASASPEMTPTHRVVNPFAPIEPSAVSTATDSVAPVTAGTITREPADIATAPTELYRASIPGPEVPMLRQATRRRVGGDATPMLEIDPDGHTTFVRGEWSALSDDGLAGVAAFEDLLVRTDRGDALAQALSEALDHETSSTIDLDLGGLGRRWLHVLPIPSPHVASVSHALIAVTRHEHLDDLEVTPVEPPPVVAASNVPPAAMAALSRVTSAASATLPSPSDVVGAPADPQAVVAEVAETPSTTPASAEPLSTSQATSGPTKPSPSWGERLTALAERVEPAQQWMATRELTRAQLTAFGGVLLLALLLRTWDLTSLPTGFHGDEGVTGLEALRVLDEGSIGVYTGSALGQPTGPFYLHAISVGLLGNTILATRLVSVLAGVLTVAATYLVVQKRFGHRIGLAGAVAMATITWSIHFSRIVFGVSWWPLATLVAIAAVDRAAKEGTGRAWFLAGGAAIFGVYVYNSHWVFGLAVVAFLITWLLWRHERPVNRNPATLVWGPIGALVVGLPMIRFAFDDSNGYFNHFDLVSRRSTPEWIESSFFGKVDLFVGWYLDTWNVLLISPVSDGADAAGEIKQVPLIFTVLAAIGVVEVLRNHRTAFTGMVLTTLVVMPIAPALTIGAQMRRDFAMVTCIAVLAGFGAVAVLGLVAAKLNAAAARNLAIAMAAIVLFTSVVPYFTTFRNGQGQKWVFAEELTATVDAVEIAQQDGPVFVNWYSGRHYWDYPTIAFLLEGTPGANRTPLDQGYIENPALELTDGVVGDQVYVFIGDYADNLEALEALYPDGRIIATQPNPRLVAYEVPG